MAPKHRDGDVIVAIPGSYISILHTVFAYAAFLGAFFVGVALHYHKIVENEFYGYPQEWFPSVSATIGDRYPERSVFQLFIALTSGPRFILVLLWYVLTAKPGSSIPKAVLGVGIFRSLSCGGWSYITSTDDHDWHDIFMISYLVATLPWTMGCIASSPPNPKAIRYRKRCASLFFGTLIPLIYFFIQHKVHKVPGAYTIYAFFEWALVLLDVAFDACTVFDFEGFEIVVKDIKGQSRNKDKNVSATLATGFLWTEALDAAADVYLGFVFWSVATSLGLLVWYFPLWHMGLSGYEALVMSTVSPLLLASRPIRRFVLQNLRIFHLLSLSGLLAWLVERPDLRLFTVGFAVSMACLSWSATFYSERSQWYRVEARALGFGIGLIASSVAKFAFQTNNPIWPAIKPEDGGWHKLGLLLAVLSVLRSTRHPVSGSDGPSARSKPGFSYLAGLGLAGVIFAMHYLFSDSSTIISWVWDGYPVRGPLAVPHGVYTLLAMSAGTMAGVFYPSLVSTWTAFGVGSLGAAVLTTRMNWLGFYGGLLLAAYVMAISPALISNAVKYGPASTFGFGFLMYNIMVLFSVWVVAYAFVPGGPLVRERTDWVMLATMLLIGAGVFSANLSPKNPNLGGRSNKSSAPYNSNNAVAQQRRHRPYYAYILLALQVLAASTAYLRFPAYSYTPHHPSSQLITAGIWTIHFSIDSPMHDSRYRMSTLLRELEIDVIGLLESDLQRIIMGNRDVTQFFSEELGMYADYGPGPNKNTWGAALLSKFPIVNSTHHLLPSPVGELAPAIAATIDAYGTLVDVYVFHSGQEEDPEDRRQQSEYLADLMGSSDRPAILLSYLVLKPGEGNYNTYVSERSGMRDIDPSDWDRWCEYILYKNVKRTAYARVSRDSITDTELQVGKFQVGLPPHQVGGEMVEEGVVPEDMRFPALFMPPGVRGHAYHVFDQPRYFA
ncbi:MAG: hypothetical protein M1831_006421 [Alyxoria varia]|nr:MAG: hypothetical protein M1831_006421 [Alyxoria varia]